LDSLRYLQTTTRLDDVVVEDISRQVDSLLDEELLSAGLWRAAPSVQALLRMDGFGQGAVECLELGFEVGRAAPYSLDPPTEIEAELVRRGYVRVVAYRHILFSRADAIQAGFVGLEWRNETGAR
jgi:hypothetical protein